MRKETTWQRTRTPGLLKHRGGLYYGRFHVGGKSKFVPLKTNVLEVAKRRFSEHKSGVERVRKAARKTKSGSGSMGDLLEMYREQVKDRAAITENTRTLLLSSANYIEKTWPRFKALQPDQITASAVTTWRNRALSKGTGFRPPGAKTSTATTGRSASTFNKAVDALRRMLDIAVDRGGLHANVLAGRRGIKAPDKPRKPELPEVAKLRELFAEIERVGGRAIEAADFCRFLAFTGCRQNEAASVTWADVDLVRGILRIRGTKTEAAAREVPIIPPARQLLERLHEKRKKSARLAVNGEPFVDPASRVVGVTEAGKSLARACAVVGTPRLTHHDLRDAFATQAIESGVDIPTVAGWLGHADGGALLMRVYAHHRRAHSVAQAAKVSFGGVL